MSRDPSLSRDPDLERLSKALRDIDKFYQDAGGDLPCVGDEGGELGGGDDVLGTGVGSEELIVGMGESHNYLALTDKMAFFQGQFIK